MCLTDEEGVYESIVMKACLEQIEKSKHCLCGYHSYDCEHVDNGNGMCIYCFEDIYDFDIMCDVYKITIGSGIIEARYHYFINEFNYLLEKQNVELDRYDILYYELKAIEYVLDELIESFC